MDTVSRKLEEFHFRRLRRHRLFTLSSNLKSSVEASLCTSNRFGIAIVGFENVLKIFQADVIEQLEVTKEYANVGVVNFPYRKVSICGLLIRLGVNCNSSIVSACVLRDNGGLFAVFYDVKALAIQADGALLSDIRLSSGDVELCDFRWNPGSPFNFAWCTSDGTVCVGECVPGSGKISITNSRRLADESGTCTCLSWSPKGKQLMVATDNGYIHQYKTDLQLVKKVEITIPEVGSAKIVDVCWISTHVFITAYWGPAENCLCVAVVITHKDQAPEVLDFGILCSMSSEQVQKPRYHFLSIPEWNMVICASNASTESAVVAYCSSSKKWQSWMLDDTGRAELPLTHDNKDTYCWGLALDCTRVQNVPLNEAQTLPPMPILLMLSSDGLIVPFVICNNMPDIPVITTAPAEQLLIKPSSEGLESQQIALKEQPLLRKEEMPKPLPVLQQTEKPYQNGGLLNNSVSIMPKPMAETGTPKLDINIVRLISEEITAFFGDFNTVRNIVASPLHGCLDVKQLSQLDSAVTELNEQSSAASKTIMSFKTDAAALRCELLDSFASAEEAKLRWHSRNWTDSSSSFGSRRNLSFLVSRNERQILNFYAMSKRLQTTIHSLHYKLTELQNSSTSKRYSVKDHSINRHGTAELLFRTLSNMQAIIAELTKKIERLKLRVVKVQSQSYSTFNDRSRFVDSATSLLANRMHCLASIRNGSVKSLSAMQQFRLKEFLSSHDATLLQQSRINSPSSAIVRRCRLEERLVDIHRRFAQNDVDESFAPSALMQPSKSVPQKSATSLAFAQHKPAPVAAITSAPAPPTVSLDAVLKQQPVSQPKPVPFSMTATIIPPVSTTTVTVDLKAKLPPMTAPTVSSTFATPPSKAVPKFQDKETKLPAVSLNDQKELPLSTLTPVASNVGMAPKFSFAKAATTTTASQPSAKITPLTDVSRVLPPPVTATQASKAEPVQAFNLSKPILPTTTVVPASQSLLSSFSFGKPLNSSTPVAVPSSAFSTKLLQSATPKDDSAVMQPQASAAKILSEKVPLSAPEPKASTAPVPKAVVSVTSTELPSKPVATSHTLVTAELLITTKTADVFQPTQVKATAPTVLPVTTASAALPAVLQTSVVSVPSPPPPVAVAGTTVSSMVQEPERPSVDDMEEITDVVPDNVAAPSATAATNATGFQSFSFKISSPAAPASAVSSPVQAAQGFGSPFGVAPSQPSAFGGGGFFSGLGGKPSAESANKNPFGGGFSTSPSSGSAAQTSSLFGAGGPSKFGGGFGSPLRDAAVVSSAPAAVAAASGFSFASPTVAPNQQQLQQPTAQFGAFGSSPTFGGGTPAQFGSPSAFGGASAFGSAHPTFGSTTGFGGGFGSATFGQQQASVPSFGSLGMGSGSAFGGSSGPTFGALAQEAGGTTSFGATFGSLQANTSPKFSQFRG